MMKLLQNARKPYPHAYTSYVNLYRQNASGSSLLRVVPSGLEQFWGGTVILSKRGYDVIFYPHIETSHQLLTIDATVEQKPLPELCKESGDILQATCLTDDSLNRGIHRLGFCGVHPASTRVENVRKSLCHTLCK